MYVDCQMAKKKPGKLNRVFAYTTLYICDVWWARARNECRNVQYRCKEHLDFVVVALASFTLHKVSLPWKWLRCFCCVTKMELGESLTSPFMIFPVQENWFNRFFNNETTKIGYCMQRQQLSTYTPLNVV